MLILKNLAKLNLTLVLAELMMSCLRDLKLNLWLSLAVYHLLVGANLSDFVH